MVDKRRLWESIPELQEAAHLPQPPMVIVFFLLTLDKFLMSLIW